MAGAKRDKLEVETDPQFLAETNTLAWLEMSAVCTKISRTNLRLVGLSDKHVGVYWSSEETPAKVELGSVGRGGGSINGPLMS